MKLDPAGVTHLTYCTNVHPGESLVEVEVALRSQVSAVRRELGVAQMGVGLRLAAQAAEELDEPGALQRFQALLDEQGLYVFTLNGFPYGAFHRQRVKEQVYEPDWRSDERVLYSNRLAHILSHLLPQGTNGSISTVPLGFRPHLGRNDEPRIVTNLLRHASELYRLREQTGCLIELGLEPEPHCYLETLSEAADFLERGPFSGAGIAQFAVLTGLSTAQAADFLRQHLGVCLDACHMAVEFEEPAAALGLLKSRGIRVSKLQISAGLRCEFTGSPAHDAPLLQALEKFVDGVYLHQVVEQHQGVLTRYLDLPEAIASRGGYSPSACEWRIHFHVPIFMEALGLFQSTRTELQQLLAHQKRTPFSSHLEVETYTWDVLPEENQPASLVQAIAHEVKWAQQELAAPTISV